MGNSRPGSNAGGPGGSSGGAEGTGSRDMPRDMPPNNSLAKYRAPPPYMPGNGEHPIAVECAIDPV